MYFLKQEVYSSAQMWFADLQKHGKNTGIKGQVLFYPRNTLDVAVHLLCTTHRTHSASSCVDCKENQFYRTRICEGQGHIERGCHSVKGHLLCMRKVPDFIHLFVEKKNSSLKPWEPPPVNVSSTELYGPLACYVLWNKQKIPCEAELVHSPGWFVWEFLILLFLSYLLLKIYLGAKCSRVKAWTKLNHPKHKF